MARARRLIPVVEMPELLDLQSVQLRDRRLPVALAALGIDRQTARLMMCGLQVSANVAR